jgi:Ser/Thr protein kinase RdoA (MazF antagonist)
MPALGGRLTKVLTNLRLDRGICHLDLTLDNMHLQDGSLTVFDFESAGVSWRAIEPHAVLKQSEDYFIAWLKGYRLVRSFAEADEQAVAAFVIIGNLRVAAWDLGMARSSRGKPRLTAADMSGVVDDWLKWEERFNLASSIR